MDSCQLFLANTATSQSLKSLCMRLPATQCANKESVGVDSGLKGGIIQFGIMRQRYDRNIKNRRQYSQRPCQANRLKSPSRETGSQSQMRPSDLPLTLQSNTIWPFR